MIGTIQTEKIKTREEPELRELAWARVVNLDCMTEVIDRGANRENVEARPLNSEGIATELLGSRWSGFWTITNEGGRHGPYHPSELIMVRPHAVENCRYLALNPGMDVETRIMADVEAMIPLLKKTLGVENLEHRKSGPGKIAVGFICCSGMNLVEHPDGTQALYAQNEICEVSSFSDMRITTGSNSAP